MLIQAGLSKKFKEAIEDTVPNAIENALNSSMSVKSEEAEKANKELADMIGKLLAEPLAERLSSAIDTYIKSACIYGTIITAGSPVTQTAVIPPGCACGMATSGKVPNTLGVM